MVTGIPVGTVETAMVEIVTVEIVTVEIVTAVEETMAVDLDPALEAVEMETTGLEETVETMAGTTVGTAVTPEARETPTRIEEDFEV